MPKTLSFLILLTCGLAGVSAQDATTLQVAPSDQVRYPDASEILNKTEPKDPAATPVKATEQPANLPTRKPLVTSTPVPAAVPRVKTAEVPLSDANHGWFLKWTLTGDEPSVLGWAQELGLPATIHPLAAGQWEVWAGPVEPASLKTALKGQGGLATLVKK